jgi:Domain of unknown function (DUF5127)
VRENELLLVTHSLRTLYFNRCLRFIWQYPLNRQMAVHTTIQIYSDIGAGTLSKRSSLQSRISHLPRVAEWISGDDTLTAQWNTNTSSSSIIHSVHLNPPQQFTVLNHHIQGATAYYGTMSGSAVTWQTTYVSRTFAENCSFNICFYNASSRDQFLASGHLPNTSDLNFQPVWQ